MPKYKCSLSYDGSSFHGWQIQPNGISIQESLQKALETILQHPIKVIGSGRTDAKVHALGQVAHFTTEKNIDTEKFLFSFNCLLPPSVRILHMEKVSDDFHAQYSAKEKTYLYHLFSKKKPPPFWRHYVSYTPYDLRLDLLKDMTRLLTGVHNFTSFANKPAEGSVSKDPVRNILFFDVKKKGALYTFEITANGFLYKMVRNLVGTLIDLARKEKAAEEVLSILEKKDRREAGRAAPPEGLFLKRVIYPGYLTIQESSPFEDHTTWEQTQIRDLL